MSYQISNSCTACGSCQDACPVEAIASGNPAYKIDAAKCIDCGACASECPVDAISEA